MAQITVVRDHEQRRRAVRAIEHPNVIDDGEDHRICRAPAAVSDYDARCDPLISQAALGRSVKDEFDGRPGRDRTAESADERGLRGGTLRAGDGVEQVGAVHEETLRGGEWISIGVGHRHHRTRRRGSGRTHGRAGGRAGGRTRRRRVSGGAATIAA